MPLNKITVIDFLDQREKISAILKAGVNFEQVKVGMENIETVLRKHVGPGDIIVDLAWNIDAMVILRWCYENEVRYINTSVEQWDPSLDIEINPPMKEVCISVKWDYGSLK